MRVRPSAIFLFLLLPVSSISQDLLVNGGFEDENICTEYQVNCSPEGWITNKDGFGTYFKDTSAAHSGNRFVAIEIGHLSKVYQRTFYRSRLVCGLRKGNAYRLEFYIRSPFFVLDSMGILFTPFDFLFSKKKLHNLSPTMFLKPASGRFPKDTNWQKVSMEYIASGEESFFTIASFARLDMKGNGTRDVPNGHFFVFLDDISLRPLQSHEQLCAEAETGKQAIYEQDERHEYLRQKIRQNNDEPPLVTLPSMSIITVDTLLLPDMLFASGAAELKSSSYPVFDELVRQVGGKKIDSVVIEGHTDNTGTPSFNQKLSIDRAEAVKKVLRQRLQWLQVMISTRGWADKRPVRANTTAAGRQQNRRVELFVYTRE